MNEKLLASSIFLDFALFTTKRAVTYLFTDQQPRGGSP